MTTIDLPIQVIIYSIVGFLGIAGSLVAVYVSLSNTISNHKVRIHELESKINHVENVLDEHDDNFKDMFNKIQDGIHRLELMIEKLKK